MRHDEEEFVIVGFQAVERSKRRSWFAVVGLKDFGEEMLTFGVSFCMIYEELAQHRWLLIQL